MTIPELMQRYLASTPSEQGQPQSDAQNKRFNAWAESMLPPGETDYTKIPDTALPAIPATQANNPFVSSPALQGAVDTALLNGATGAGMGGNTQQVQGSNQSGDFVSTGTQTSGQTSGATSGVVGSTTGQTNQTQTGTTAGQTTGTNSNTSVGSTANAGNTIGSTSNTGVTTGQTTQDGTSTAYNNQNVNGQSQSTDTGTTSQNTVGNVATNNTATGATTGATTNVSSGLTQGTTNQTGTSTTGVVDTLGFGDLLKSQVGQAGLNDSARTAFLTDLVNTGGSSLNGQVDQAVRNSLSGPGMSGVGQSAQARAAGYAASDIARNNMDQRLGASAQLAGPTATTTLAGAGNPFLGGTQASNVAGTNSQTQQGVNTGTSVGTSTQNELGNTASNTNVTGTSANTNVTNNNQNTTGVNTGVSSQTGTANQQNSNEGTSQGSTSQTGTSNQSNIGASSQNQSGTSSGNTAGTSSGTSLQDTIQSGFSNLVNQETNSGNTRAASTAIAAGNTPMQETSSGGGGCYVSSVMAVDGCIGKRSIRRAVAYKLYERKDKFMPIGYSLIGPAIARGCVKWDWMFYLFLPLVRAVLYEELRLSGCHLRFRLSAWSAHLAFHWSTSCLGWFGALFGRSFETRDKALKQLLQQHNLYFSL